MRFFLAKKIIIRIYISMKNYICLLLFLVVSSFFSFQVAEASFPLSGRIFVIDAGHGGVDPGTVVGSIYEKDINLKISKVLQNEIIKLGGSVLMTREGDYDLGTPNATYRKKSDFDHRISFINSSKADYYISIHLNYLSDSRYRGVQVFYSSADQKNEAIASSIQNYMNEKLGTDREIKKISSTIYMYSKLTVPGVLVECGFLSNSSERALLLNDEYILQFSKYLAKSLVNI